MNFLNMFLLNVNMVKIENIFSTDPYTSIQRIAFAVNNIYEFY